MSCLSKIGCASVVVLAGVGAWWYAGGELPFEITKRTHSSQTTASGRQGGTRPVVWSNIGGDQTPSAEASDALEVLSRRDGPAFVSLGAADLAGLLGAQLQRALPRSAATAQIAIVDDLILVRADVAVRDLGGDALLGPLGRVFGDRDTLQVAGRLEIVRPGLAQFRVHELRIHDVGVPTRLIPMAISALRSGTVRTDSLSNDALPVPLPRTIADVRVARGRVTFYKTIPQ